MQWNWMLIYLQNVIDKNHLNLQNKQVLCLHTCTKLNTASCYSKYYKYPDVCLSVHCCICIGKKNQLDATEWFITLIICSTCFGHFYAHHQELETICVLTTTYGVQFFVVGCRGSGAGQQAMCPGRWMSCNIPLPGHTSCSPAPDPRQPATKHCTP